MQSPNPILARRRRLVAFAIASAILGLIAAGASLYRVGLLPPKIEARQLQEGGAVTRAVVKLDPARGLDTPFAFESEAQRANLIANLMASAPILDRVGRLAGIDPKDIAATAELTLGVPRAFSEPDSERRANQILVSHDPYKLEIQAQGAVPVVDIYAQAPSAGGAVELANASVKATNAYLRDLAQKRHVDGPSPVQLTQLGTARGGALEPTAPIKIAALTFLVVFAVVFGLLFLLAQARRGWLQGDRPNAVAEVKPAARAAATRARDDWPYTTRVLPWMIAAFLVMVWLVPINAITLQASLPVDLKLDRLALPLLVLTWLLSLAIGGPSAPRWRFTKVHGAIAVFVAVAFLSVVLNAAYLNQTLELELAIKKLTLLSAFFATFLVVASVVRPTEVRPFMVFILVLASICALGILWEYRAGSNLFYEWSAKLLPGVFHVTAVNTTGYDEIGRRYVIGPSDLGLEAVAMLTMALPIALVGLMQSKRARQRILFALAVCVLLGATIATYRKSALLAPLSAIGILAYFRRRELLKLAPLGIVILLAVPILAPNALGSIVDQFEPNRLGVSTVSDRVSDYDAIRPDLLSHPAFGRGFGSYEHSSYRVLDNDLLMRIVETGLVGLATFILMLVLIIAIAAPIVRGRDPNLAPAALAVAAATGAFLVLAGLFDLMSFPQTPYILMVLAGFLAVISQKSDEDSPRHLRSGVASGRPGSAGPAEPPEASVPRLPTPV